MRLPRGGESVRMRTDRRRRPPRGPLVPYARVPGCSGRRGRSGGAAGTPSPGLSLLELLVTLAVLGTVTLYGAPSLVRWRQQQNLEGALRHLALEFHRACGLATASGRTHALRFETGAGQLRWLTLVDGDGDGVGEADFLAGIDVALEAEVDLARRHPGIEAGRPPGVVTLMGGAVDRDGLAFGGGKIVSCTTAMKARSGTLYLRSRFGDAAALRLYGATARLSVWWWDGGIGAWRRAG